jgi:hypothetical protein
MRVGCRRHGDSPLLPPRCGGANAQIRIGRSRAAAFPLQVQAFLTHALHHPLALTSLP